MIAYFDTSLLVGRYIYQKSGSRFAIEAAEKCEEILVSDFTLLETKNALRAACFRKEINAEELSMAMEALDDDLSIGALLAVDLDANQVLNTTDLIAEKIIPALGGRTLDLMHLAYASILKSPTFATADKRQAKCAEKLGFEVLLIS